MAVRHKMRFQIVDFDFIMDGWMHNPFEINDQMRSRNLAPICVIY